MAGEPFIFWDRRAAYDIENLLAALNEDVSSEEFASYVSHNKNDFANWLEFSLQNKMLADKIRPLVERDLIKAVLYDAVGKETAKMIIADSHTVHDPAVHEVLEKSIGSNDEKKDAAEVHAHEGRTHSAHPDAIDISKKEDTKKKGSSLVMEFPLKINKKMVIADFMFGLLCGMILGAIALGIILRLIV
jgi:hypothetical protein